MAPRISRSVQLEPDDGSINDAVRIYSTDITMEDNLSGICLDDNYDPYAVGFARGIVAYVAKPRKERSDEP